MDFRQNKTKHTISSSPSRFANYKPAHGNVWMPRINYHTTLSLDLLSRIYLHLCISEYTCFWNNTFSKCELIARFSSSPANCRCHPELHEYAWCNIIVFDMNDGFVQQLNMKCNMHRVLQKYNSVVTQIEGARVYKRTQLNDNNELINCLTAHKGLI